MYVNKNILHGRRHQKHKYMWQIQENIYLHVHSTSSIEHLPNGQHQRYSSEQKMSKILSLGAPGVRAHLALHKNKTKQTKKSCPCSLYYGEEKHNKQVKHIDYSMVLGAPGWFIFWATDCWSPLRSGSQGWVGALLWDLCWVWVFNQKF